MTHHARAGRSTLLASAAITTALLCATPVRANVSNAGFEAGNFSGWTLTGDTSFSGVGQVIGRAGGFGAYFGPDGVATLSQVITTAPGTDYTVRFWLALDDSATPNSFSWSWGGVTQSVLTNVAAFDYVALTATLTATGNNTNLRFDFSNPQSFWLLDDVSVTAVPEPASAVLLALGLAAVGLARARRLAA
jgi:hypothetical protein